MKKTILVLVMFASLTMLGCDNGGVQKNKCGIESCHGLDISCGSNVPEVCTEEYRLGDFCRSEALCEEINGECRFLFVQKFEDCKLCITPCMNISDAEDAFACEAECRTKLGFN